MTDVMQGLVHEAKRSKYSAIGQSLSDDDVVQVWGSVSAFIEKQMTNQKGVQINGLGTFTFSQKKLDVGNNKFILIQRPVFLLSEKFAQTHGLKSTKHHTTGQIPIVSLNFSALSCDTPFDRDTVEGCVKEVLGALARSVNARRNVEFTFTGIGRLQIRDSKAKMKFYREFINSMDGSGKIVDTMMNRPGTVDSVMSERAPSRANSSNTLLLPRITQGGQGLAPEGDKNGMPTIREDEEEAGGVMPEANEEDVDIMDQEEYFKYVNDNEDNMENEEAKPFTPPQVLTSRSGSRITAPLAKASGVCFADDLLPVPPTPKSMRGSKLSPTPHRLTPISDLGISPRPASSPAPLGFETPEMSRSKVFDDLDKPFSPPTSVSLLAKPLTPVLTPHSPPHAKSATPPRTASSCGHPSAGQELCYLCHQRERRNIPVSFTEERLRREQEEDKMLQQYQQVKDTEAILQDQERKLALKYDSQKMAAFNLGVSEAIKFKKSERPTDFYPSYVFQKRPLTPPRFHKQEKYFRELEAQVKVKDDVFKKTKADEEFLERLEQVQLAEDLAAQREQYLKDKNDQQDQYKRALSAQLRFKPLPMPAREPDSSEPVFGVNDLNAAKMAENRRRAFEVMKEQIDTVAKKKKVPTATLR